MKVDVRIAAVTQLNTFAPAGTWQCGTVRKAKRIRTLRSVCRAQIAEDVEVPQEAPVILSAQEVAVLDKLIAVFASKNPKEWRKLIAHSQQWPQLAEKVFER